MKRVKTAKGRMLDMGALAAKHEDTRAVSNLNMNARGDIIDNRGNVTISREKISKEFYKNNVPGADTEEISIKEEETVAVKKTVEPPKPAPKKQATPKAKATPKATPKEKEPVTEVSRRGRTRDDGTQYFEVEYSDGSMEDIDQ
jgi:outer membrane biosynthesis protein TonB